MLLSHWCAIFVRYKEYNLENMLKTILSIAGKPGLYKLVSQGKNMLIVETISADKKRMPAYSADKIISLGDIAMYTHDSEVPLADVLEAMKTKEEGKITSINGKKASSDELKAYLQEVLPDFDEDRVYASDIKKLISWYNLLIENGISDFAAKEEDVAEAEESAE